MLEELGPILSLMDGGRRKEGTNEDERGEGTGQEQRGQDRSRGEERCFKEKLPPGGKSR